jgi:glucosamine--fructose-6-phosphate aminotransferase (isomerizing)
MCGIFVYIGSRNGVRFALDGLKKIEYRGYDSAGIAYVKDGSIVCKKAVGKLPALAEKLSDDVGSCVIGHTRWATHGGVCEENAHPILDATGSIAVIHNGIVENYQQLRHELEREGVHFRTGTDTEVIPNLIAAVYKGDLLAAVQEVMGLITGSWAIAVIHKDHPEECILAKHSSPLVIGIGVGETFAASDPNALIHHTRDVMFLSDGEVARATAKGVELFDAQRIPVSKQIEQIKHSVEELSKGDFEHFTLKEIFEQPQTIRNAMLSRFFEEYGTVCFDELQMKPADLLSISRIIIVACGTSHHAGLIASYMFEELARIPTEVEYSSEFRSKNPIVEKGTLAIAISQSGETADTVAAVRELKAKGAMVVALCNVQGSTISRDADHTLFLHAGPEVGVCSTKAFTSQLVVLSLFALMIGRLRYMSKNEGQEFLQALQKIPHDVEAVLAQAPEIEKLARKYAACDNFFFIGRRYMFPTCLEGALKLKELSYINANGYASGEMKHGPIALLGPSCPTFALCADTVTYEKTFSNVMEAKARHSPIIVVAFEGEEHLKNSVDHVIEIPRTRNELAPITVSIVCQLFAYYCAKERKTDIDQPKNLAKSVTVE